jgi:hypothetical protein
VFLRVLEYYEGILILTSIRVGTFDEAFQSRIQLSLHYEPLTESQRITIWKNFLRRLKTPEQEEQARINAADVGENQQANESGSKIEDDCDDQSSSMIDYADIKRHI